MSGDKPRWGRFDHIWMVRAVKNIKRATQK